MELKEKSYICSKFGQIKSRDKDNMTVSIIIPIYNVEHYIEACIASVAAQTFQDFDILAIDDCTKDFSIEVLKASVEKYHIPKEKVQIIKHDRNRGLSAARNTGIEASTARYVYFLDSDDTITPDCLEKLVGAAKNARHKVDMVVGNYLFDGPELGCPHIAVKKKLLCRREYIKSYCKELIYPMAWNRLVKRDFIQKHRLFFEEGLIHEDTLWNFQILQYVGRVGIVRDNTYIYRVRQNSIQSSSDFERHFKANTYIVGKLAEIMFGSTLKYNKYVYNFVEKEKLRHLYDCFRSGNMHLVRTLYTVCRTSRHYSPYVATLLFGYDIALLKRIWKRDKHYILPFEEGLKVYANLPKTL